MLPRSLRPLARLAALLSCMATCFAGAGCASRPSPADWLDVGFRSPRQAFHTFQTAIAADQPELEYRCLSSRMRRDEHLSQLGYREYRERLLRDQPWIRKVADAKVLSVVPTPSGARLLVAQVDSWFQHVRFQVQLVPEGYVEVWGEDELLHDDALSPEQRAWRVRSEAQSKSVELSIALPGSVDSERISELRGGREWKIDSFELLSP